MDELKVGLAQMAPVWLDREATLKKVIGFINEAGEKSVDLIAFGEEIVPGFQFCIEPTGGA